LGSFFLLIVGSCVLGRELSCEYGTDSGYSLWPAFNYCFTRSVDLSKQYKTVEHSFSGTSEEKSDVSVVWFKKPSHINFLPKQILNDFPRLNGILINNCDTLTTITDNFFGQDFKVLQYLDFLGNEIATIEANAFQHLTKLKRVYLGLNQLRSLPHQLFKNNPEMIAIWLNGNKINSITPEFFKNLNKLQIVYFGNYDQCTKKIFSCTSGSCSVSQEELDSGLETCYKNCLDDGECAAKSTLN
jgi:hypothetical protein